MPENIHIETNACVNCNSTFKGNFCSNCGQPGKLKRIDAHYISHEVQHVLHLEKGFFYTIKQLIVAPGKTVRTFINQDRNRLVKPTLFIILTSLLYTFIAHYFHTDGKAQQLGAANATTAIFAWIEAHYGYANIIMGIFIALWIKLFFRKQPYNFFEILILLCYVMGVGMLLFAVFVIAEGVTHTQLTLLSGIAGIGYCAWAIGNFYHPRKVMSYVKALVAYLAGMVSFWAAAMLLGTVISLFTAHP